MFPEPDFSPKQYEDLAKRNNAAEYIRQHIGSDLITPDIQFGNVGDFTKIFARLMRRATSTVHALPR